MSQLSIEAKEAIIQQVMSRGNKSIKSIACMNNVGYSTLQKWLRLYRKGEFFNRNTTEQTKVNSLSRQDQFNHIIATYNLDDVSLGKYCREHGLYSHQLIKWREALMKNSNTPKDLNQQSELKKLKEENKHLQKELRRKEKALAEASALLIMKKKQP